MPPVQTEQLNLFVYGVERCVGQQP